MSRWSFQINKPNHKFVILRNGQIETYDNFDSIPNDFEHVIEFKPQIPPPPHTKEQHEEIHQWMDKFNKLLEIEKQNGSTSSISSSII